MARILWQPDKWMWECRFCSAIIEIPFSEAKPVDGSTDMPCPICKQISLRVIRQTPAIFASGGRCSCGTDYALGDKYCPGCGEAL